MTREFCDGKEDLARQTYACFEPLGWAAAMPSWLTPRALLRVPRWPPGVSGYHGELAQPQFSPLLWPFRSGVAPTASACAQVRPAQREQRYRGSRDGHIRCSRVLAHASLMNRERQPGRESFFRNVRRLPKASRTFRCLRFGRVKHDRGRRAMWFAPKYRAAAMSQY